MTCNLIENCTNTDNCWFCKFTDNYPRGTVNNYRPINKKIKQPLAEQEKKDAKEKEKHLKATAKKSDRSKIVKNAAKVEEKVKASLNSGRVNKDGDIHSEDLVIDIKSQSKVIDPIINMKEFYKVQEDAIRANKKHGVLCLVNREGIMLYVVGHDLFESKFI